MVSELDPAQMLRMAFNEVDSTFQVELGANSGMDIQLDSVTDSVSVEGVSSSTKVSLTSASTGVVLGPVSCVGMKSFTLYTNTTATVASGQLCTLQVSPSDTDNVWFSTAVTITPSGTAATVVQATPSSAIIARRARISTTAIASGTYDLYLVMQGV